MLYYTVKRVKCIDAGLPEDAALVRPEDFPVEGEICHVGQTLEINGENYYHLTEFPAVDRPRVHYNVRRFERLEDETIEIDMDVQSREEYLKRLALGDYD